MNVRRSSPRVSIPRVALISAAAFCLATGAVAADKSPNACIVRSDINGFSAPDDHTVYVRVGVNQIFRLDLMTHCLDLTFRQAIGLEDQPATAWICSPLEATVVYRDLGVTQRCPVTAIHKLTPAEIASLPKKDLP